MADLAEAGWPAACRQAAWRLGPLRLKNFTVHDTVHRLDRIGSGIDLGMVAIIAALVALLRCSS